MLRKRSRRTRYVDRPIKFKASYLRRRLPLYPLVKRPSFRTAPMPARENKHIETQGTNFDLFDGSANALVDFISGITTGTGGTNKIGKAVMVSSLSWRMRVNSTEPALICCMLVYVNSPWKSTDYAATDFLEEVLVTSPLNIENTSRFVVLMDRCYEMRPAFDSEAVWKCDKMFRKLNHKVEWQSSSDNGEATLTKGGFFFVAISEGLATTECNLSYDTRIRFTG